MMDQVKVAKYLETFFWSKVPETSDFSSSFRKKEDVLNEISRLFVNVIDTQKIVKFKYNPMTYANYILDLLMENKFIVKIDGDIAGAYYKFRRDYFKNIKQKKLKDNEIFNLSETIGKRFFVDAFNEIGNNQNIEIDFGILANEDAASDDADSRSPDNDESLAPASDRIVTLDHNNSKHAEISEKLEELKQAVRGANALPVDDAEKEHVLKGLESAKCLWSEAQLKYLQIEVGIIMAIKAAGVLLKDTAQKTFSSSLIDLIKDFLRNSGIL